MLDQLAFPAVCPARRALVEQRFFRLCLRVYRGNRRRLVFFIHRDHRDERARRAVGRARVEQVEPEEEGTRLVARRLVERLLRFVV